MSRDDKERTANVEDGDDDDGALAIYDPASDGLDAASLIGSNEHVREEA